MLAIQSEEQELLAATVRSLTGSIGVTEPSVVAAIDRDKAWQTLASAGLLGLRVRDDGDPLASGVDVMVVAQALGAGLAVVPFIPSGVLASELLWLAKADESLVEAIGAGESRPALVMDAQLIGLADLAHPGPIAVWGAAGADHGLALRSTAEGVRVVRVEIDDSFTPAAVADLTASFASRSTAEGLRVTELGSPVDDSGLDRWTALALTLVSADCAGTIRVALDGVVEYSKHRYAYGVPVGSFQALQHMCADAFTRCEAAVTTTNYAAWAVDELPSREALLAARTAKAWIAAVARDVAETVMQVYGGIGQTWEHIAHVHARRALLDIELLGNANRQLDEIYRLRQEVR